VTVLPLVTGLPPATLLFDIGYGALDVSGCECEPEVGNPLDVPNVPEIATAVELALWRTVLAGILRQSWHS